LSALLNDPGLKMVLSDTQSTSQNAAELMQYLKTTVVDNDLQGQINESVSLLSSSLTRLSNVMENLEAVTEDKETIESIMNNTRSTSENLNRFSERLNKRFLLFRLLF
jgi:methyl-accepting chemotaxis protein